MILKRQKRYFVSRELDILRAFVDAIRTAGDDVLISVAYRKGRAFCRYDKNLNLLYRVEEEYLNTTGFGDFRSFTAGPGGEFVLAGTIRPNTASIFKLNGKGRIKSTGFLPDFPLLESLAMDSQGNYYLHSPVREFPLYRFAADMTESVPMGQFPPGNGGVTRNMARVLVDKDDFPVVIFETSPAHVHRYSPDGGMVFSREIGPANDSIDSATAVLDAGLCPATGNIYILKDRGDGKKRPVEIISPLGETVEEFELPAFNRRLHIAPGGFLYSSFTRFGIPGMIISGNIYGATTVIDKYKITQKG